MPTTPVPFELPEAMAHGAHRIRFEGRGSEDAWSHAMDAFRERIADTAMMSTWSPRDSLTVVAHEVVPSGAIAYLAGSTELWHALAQTGVENRSVVAVSRCLERRGGHLDRVVCESRPLDTSGYERAVAAALPWRVDHRDPEVREVRPVGTVSKGQLEGLALILSATVREWADLTPQEVTGPPARVVDDHVELAVAVGTGRVVEHIYIWWQVCWVEMDAVQLGPQPDAPEREATLADELRELARWPIADRKILPRLERLLGDHTPARVSIPAMYADIAFLAAHALAAVRRACGIDEPVVAAGVAHPLDDAAIAALCIIKGLDPRGADPLEVVRQLMARGAWPVADLRIPGELTPRDPALLAALQPPPEPAALPPRGVHTLDDGEVRRRIHDLATGDAQTRVRALPHPLSEKSGSPELRNAIEACLEDRAIAVVEWFGSARPGRGPWLGEVRWAAAWSLAWERRVAGIDDKVVLDDVLVPVPRAEAERVARAGRNAPIGFLVEALGRERANLPRRRLEIAPRDPIRPDDEGVERLRAAIAAGDSFRIDVILDGIAGGHLDDPRFEPMLEGLTGPSGSTPARQALDALRAVLRPGEDHVISMLRALSGQTPVELADHIARLAPGGLTQGAMVTYFKRVFPGIPLRVLLEAGAWRRVSGGDLDDDGFNALLEPWLRPGS